VPSPDEVARKAYFTYVNEGSPLGRHVQHWLDAEAQLIAERNRTRVHVTITGHKTKFTGKPETPNNSLNLESSLHGHKSSQQRRYHRELHRHWHGDRKMVRERARELALIEGRVPPQVLQVDYEQAKRELTGGADLDPQAAVLESAPESERWDSMPAQPDTKHRSRRAKTRMTKAEAKASNSPNKASPKRNTIKCSKPPENPQNRINRGREVLCQSL